MISIKILQEGNIFKVGFALIVLVIVSLLVATTIFKQPLSTHLLVGILTVPFGMIVIAALKGK